MLSCGRERNRPPEDIYASVLGVCVWDTLHGKGDFAEVIKLRTLIWEDFPGLSSGPNTVTGSP